ncbi:helix-turn-helix domain-containing protein [Mammaliicoccus vitulinus]|uniref:helix-turn-helix domain-containing protein n=1 Tax=Mammaliicoccus vitulinus TaxID=71237 RepID=UPI00361E661A
MYDAIRAVYGDDSSTSPATGTRLPPRPESRSALIGLTARRKAVVETVEQSKDLVAWGGNSEIDAHQKRVQEGWLEARVESDRWDLLGFADVNFATELKIYQITDWHKRPPSDPFAHPKIEASFAGADGKLLTSPSGTTRWTTSGPSSPPTRIGPASSGRTSSRTTFSTGLELRRDYQRPTGRREHLRQRYQEVATEVYREALKDSTVAVYDILRVIATETGATYDMLEDRTGLARSTIRYHVARLAREGVVKRLGNPVLVVPVSRDSLERSREILDRARRADR